MRKIAATILCVFAITGSLCAFAEPKATVSHAENALQTELIAPSSYEQYLPLQAPSDIATSDEHTAISDGRKVYVYDKSAKIYRVYEHERNVTKLQFGSDGKLYFLDSSTYLSTLNPKTLTKGETDIVCSTFLLNGKDIYYTNMSGNTSQISKFDTKSQELTTLKSGLTYPPVLAFYKDELYYTTWTGVKAQIQKLHPETKGEAEIASFNSELVSLSIKDNVLYASLTDGTFCVYDLLKLSQSKDASNTEALFQEKNAYSALSISGEYAYVVKENSVRQFSVVEKAFTSYEIASASASKERLNGATDICLTQTQAILADNGNERISVYDLKSKRFQTPIATDLQPTFLASDGNTVLAANETEAVLYNLATTAYGTQLTQYATFEGQVVGACSVYGKYYLVTDKNQFITLEQTNNAWNFKTVQKSSTKYPSLLTSDVYGNLYTVCNESVYKYTEESFASVAVSNDEVCSQLPTATQKISFDYQGDLYALSAQSLHKYTAQKSEESVRYVKSTEFPLNETQVCGIEAEPVSFALSIEENATYVLDKNNYLIKRMDIRLPTVKTIPVNGADERILNAENATFTLVKVDKNALMVEFDFNAISKAEYFPYRSFQRTKERITAVRLGQTGVYDILAFYDKNKNCHVTYLVYTASCEELPLSAYEKTYTETEQKTAYLSSAVSLYKTPYMNGQMAVCKMERGAKILLLSEINGLNLTYYRIAYVDETGAQKTGYIPANYVSPMSGEMQQNTPTYGDERSKTDSVWRLMYILLGCGVIGLLADYLILRKKD